eukprot:scaffold2844_cov326-Pavlova_lutheri.AAC.23
MASVSRAQRSAARTRRGSAVRSSEFTFEFSPRHCLSGQMEKKELRGGSKKGELGSPPRVERERETDPMDRTGPGQGGEEGQQRHSFHHFHGADAVESQGVLVLVPQVPEPFYVQGVVVVHHRFEIRIALRPIRPRHLQRRTHHRNDGRALRHEAKQVPEVPRHLGEDDPKTAVEVVQPLASRSARPGRSCQERVRLPERKDGNQG